MASLGLAARNSGDQTRTLSPTSRPISDSAASVGCQVYPYQHGEDGLFVMVIHLNLSNVRPFAGDEVNDRIGQPGMVGSDGGDDDLHFGSRFRVRGSGFDSREPGAFATGDAARSSRRNPHSINHFR